MRKSGCTFKPVQHMLKPWHLDVIKILASKYYCLYWALFSPVQFVFLKIQVQAGTSALSFGSKVLEAEGDLNTSVFNSSIKKTVLLLSKYNYPRSSYVSNLTWKCLSVGYIGTQSNLPRSRPTCFLFQTVCNLFFLFKMNVLFFLFILTLKQGLNTGSCSSWKILLKLKWLKLIVIYSVRSYESCSACVNHRLMVKIVQND